jgi:hypothetical protein
MPSCRTNPNARHPAADFLVPAPGDISLYISLCNVFIRVINVYVHIKKPTEVLQIASGTPGGGAGSQHQLHE